MRAALLLIAALLLTGCAPQSAERLQAEHARGNCGDLKAGTGLTWWPDGTVRGEVTTMLPGRTEFRMRGPGAVAITLAGLTAIDMQARDFRTITITGAVDGQSVLEWRPAGVPNWSKVPTTFLYPRRVTQAQLDVDNAIKYDLPIPGVNKRASELRDPRRIVSPEERRAMGTRLAAENYQPPAPQEGDF